MENVLTIFLSLIISIVYMVVVYYVIKMNWYYQKSKHILQYVIWVPSSIVFIFPLCIVQITNKYISGVVCFGAMMLMGFVIALLRIKEFEKTIVTHVYPKSYRILYGIVWGVLGVVVVYTPFYIGEESYHANVNYTIPDLFGAAEIMMSLCIISYYCFCNVVKVFRQIEK